MRRYVEDFPAIDIGFLRRKGLFQAKGPNTVEVDTAIGPVRFSYSHGDDNVSATLPNGPTGPTTRRIGLVVKQLRFGERAFFVCPITKTPVTKLYVVNWTFGSRKAHGLVHLSKSSGMNERAKGRARHIADRLKGSAGRAPARGAKRRALISDLQQYSGSVKLDQETEGLIWATRRRDEGLSRARSQVRPFEGTSTRSAILRGRDPASGWTEAKVLRHLGAPLQWAKANGLVPLGTTLPPDYIQARPQLDARVLKSEGLLQPGVLRGAVLLWQKDLMGVLSEVLAAFDLRDPNRPVMFIRGRDTFYDKDYDQLIELIPHAGRWYLRCPISGARATIFYLKEGRFASRRAQELFYRRPTPQKAPGMSRAEFKAFITGTGQQ
jgi:hypothetical protein